MLLLYDRANKSGFKRSLRKGWIFMRRNIFAALALMLWGAGLTAVAVAQQPVKLSVLNDQTGLHADLTGMGSVQAARMAVEDYDVKVLGRPSKSSSPTTRTSPTLAPASRGNGRGRWVNVILDLPNSAVARL